jgi:hypothetical protein
MAAIRPLVGAGDHAEHGGGGRAGAEELGKDCVKACADALRAAAHVSRSTTLRVVPLSQVGEDWRYRNAT